jgi:uncharacterized protein (DUF302 family)
MNDNSKTRDKDVASSATIQHMNVATGLSYDALVSAFEQELGHLDPTINKRLIEQKAAWSDVEETINKIGGKHGLMIIFRADQGKITSLSGQEKRCSLYLVGNPVIANKIISIEPGASFYVPFRVALYEAGGPEGAIISYDRPSSFLATFGRPELVEIGLSLDRKIDGVAAALRSRS